MKELCKGINIDNDGIYYCSFCGEKLPVLWTPSPTWAKLATGQHEVLTILECTQCESIVWNGKQMRVLRGTLKEVEYEVKAQNYRFEVW